MNKVGHCHLKETLFEYSYVVQIRIKVMSYFAGSGKLYLCIYLFIRLAEPLILERNVRMKEKIV